MWKRYLRVLYFTRALCAEVSFLKTWHTINMEGQGKTNTLQNCVYYTFSISSFVFLAANQEL
jgi:hypothetical protein